MPKLDIIIFANNEKKRAKGLMFLDGIEENDCAFFAFESCQRQSFWNKNVNFNIDVAFFDEDGKMCDLQVLKAHQEKPIYTKKAKYVIETNEGWFEKNKIELGHSMWDLINLEGLKKHE